jgi:hypothetical protein
MLLLNLQGRTPRGFRTKNNPAMEIERVSRDMIRNYGPNARRKAEDRLDACVGAGDVDAARIWRSVVAEIAEQQKKPD